MRWLAKVRPALPGPRDAHVYGGGLLLAIGAQVLSPGLAVFGALLLYLGLRVPGKPTKKSARGGE